MSFPIASFPPIKMKATDTRTGVQSEPDALTPVWPGEKMTDIRDAVDSWGSYIFPEGYGAPVTDKLLFCPFSGLYDAAGSEIYWGDIVQDAEGNLYELTWLAPAMGMYHFRSLHTSGQQPPARTLLRTSKVVSNRWKLIAEGLHPCPQETEPQTINSLIENYQSSLEAPNQKGVTHDAHSR